MLWNLSSREMACIFCLAFSWQRIKPIQRANCNFEILTDGWSYQYTLYIRKRVSVKVRLGPTTGRSWRSLNIKLLQNTTRDRCKEEIRDELALIYPEPSKLKCIIQSKRAYLHPCVFYGTFGRCFGWFKWRWQWIVPTTSIDPAFFAVPMRILPI